MTWKRNDFLHLFLSKFPQSSLHYTSFPSKSTYILVQTVMDFVLSQHMSGVCLGHVPHWPDTRPQCLFPTLSTTQRKGLVAGSPSWTGSLSPAPAAATGEESRMVDVQWGLQIDHKKWIIEKAAGFSQLPRTWGDVLRVDFSEMLGRIWEHQHSSGTRGRHSLEWLSLSRKR